MLFILFLSLVPLVVAKNELYMGYKVYNVKLTSQEQQDNFHLLKTDVIDYWVKPNFKYGVVGQAMLPPSQFNWFEERLEELNIEKDIFIEDVYEYLQQYESKTRNANVRNDDTNENNTDEDDTNNTNENNITGEDNNSVTDENNNVTDADKNITDEDNNTTDEDNNITDEDNNITDEDNNITDEDNNITDEDNNITDEDNNITDEDNNITDEDNNVTDEDNNITDEDGNITDEDNNITDEDEDTEETEETEEEEEISFDYVSYHRYDVILRHLYNLKETYAASTRVSIDVVEFGTTDLGRPLVYLKVTSANTEVDKPIIVIEAGVNPRQWITIPSALNIVDQILNVNEANLLDNFEWIIVPVVNPDGYEYTHTDLRFWEKNLSTKSNLGFICPGVNINRNFDIAWSMSDSSSSACSHLYAGVEAASEIETQFLQNIIETYRERIRLYISLQNGGRFISYPWQYEFAASGMFRQNHLLGMEMVAALNDGYGLDVGSVAIGDRVSGTSADYARINDALYVFNVDIVGRGEVGVLVPEVDIEYFVEDVWRAVAVAADYLIAEINQ